MNYCWGSNYNVRKLTRELRKFDSKLYAIKGSDGKTFVMREGKRYDFLKLDDNIIIRYPVNDDYMVFPLTDNWSLSGKPVSWSYFNVIQHLREIDTWNRDVFTEVVEHNEKVKASRERDFTNNTEAFLSDNYRAFQREFADIRTSNMDMKASDKRYQYDKRTKN